MFLDFLTSMEKDRFDYACKLISWDQQRGKATSHRIAQLSHYVLPKYPRKMNTQRSIDAHGRRDLVRDALRRVAESEETISKGANHGSRD